MRNWRDLASASAVSALVASSISESCLKRSILELLRPRLLHGLVIRNNSRRLLVDRYALRVDRFAEEKFGSGVQSEFVEQR